MAQFCYLRLYLGFETIFPVVCLNYGWQGWTWSERLEKIYFLCLYAMPAEITQESLWLAIPVLSSGSSFLPFSNIEQVGLAFFSNFG